MELLTLSYHLHRTIPVLNPEVCDNSLQQTYLAQYLKLYVYMPFIYHVEMA